MHSPPSLQSLTPPESKPDIAAVLTYYGWDGRVSGYGSWRNTRCPFHGDRTPSARINEEEGIFHCHVCQYSGDAWEIVKLHEGVDFIRAKEIVKELTGFEHVSLGPDNHSRTSGAIGQRLVPSKLPAWAVQKHGRKLV
jgi:DNA primase